MNSDNLQKESPLRLMDILLLLKNSLLVILLVGVIGGVVGFAISNWLIKPTYEASGLMIVNSKTEQSINVTNDQITSSQKLVDAYGVIIRSKEILSHVIDDLHLDMTWRELRGKVDVSSEDETQIMRITVRDQDPSRAVAIVTDILEVAPAQIMEIAETGTVNTVSNEESTGRPVAPNKRVYTLVGVLLGMLIVCAVVIVRDMLDDTYKTEFDIQDDLGVAALGVIPDLESCYSVAGKSNTKKRGRK